MYRRLSIVVWSLKDCKMKDFNKNPSIIHTFTLWGTLLKVSKGKVKRKRLVTSLSSISHFSPYLYVFSNPFRDRFISNDYLVLYLVLQHMFTYFYTPLFHIKRSIHIPTHFFSLFHFRFYNSNHTFSRHWTKRIFYGLSNYQSIRQGNRRQSLQVFLGFYVWDDVSTPSLTTTDVFG